MVVDGEKVMGIKIARVSEEFDPSMYATEDTIDERNIQTAYEEPRTGAEDRVREFKVDNGFWEDDSNDNDDKRTTGESGEDTGEDTNT